MEMTITRALAEIKLLEQRINKGITYIFVDCGNKANPVTYFGKTSKENVEKDIRSNIDSVNDLIKRRLKIKSEIIKSNATTKILISGDKMTVAEAIDMKGAIFFKKDYLKELKQQLSQVKEFIENQNTTISDNILSMLEKNLSKDRIADKTDYEKISKPYKEDHLVEIIDPKNIQALIENLEKEIENFESEIDFVLSESNSITKINI
jgi:serine protease inhibitor